MHRRPPAAVASTELHHTRSGDGPSQHTPGAGASPESYGGVESRPRVHYPLGKVEQFQHFPRLGRRVPHTNRQMPYGPNYGPIVERPVRVFEWIQWCNALYSSRPRGPGQVGGHRPGRLAGVQRGGVRRSPLRTVHLREHIWAGVFRSQLHSPVTRDAANRVLPAAPNKRRGRLTRHKLAGAVLLRDRPRGRGARHRPPVARGPRDPLGGLRNSSPASELRRPAASSISWEAGRQRGGWRGRVVCVPPGMRAALLGWRTSRPRLRAGPESS